MDTLLIVKLSSLGDIIHTLPAYAALRKHRPAIRLKWLVQGSGKAVLDCVPHLDKIVTVGFTKWTLRPGRFWRELKSLKKEMKSENLTAVDFQGLIKSGFFSLLSGAKRRIGFHRRNCREPQAALFYTETHRYQPEKIHVIKKNLALLENLGIQEKAIEFPLELPQDLRITMRSKLNQTGFTADKKLVLLNVGAAWPTKRWFPERWAELAVKLKEAETDLFPLLLWGSEEEKTLAEAASHEASLPMTPALDIPEVMALVKEASLVVSGDTFALQVACAFGRPVVGLFGPTTPERNGPFDPKDKTVFHEMDCSHCYRRTCKHLSCLEKITPEEVAAACLERLEQNDSQ